MAILDFSVSEWHGFGSITQGCFGISVSNFMCMSFVAVGRSLTIVSYVTFKMAALWFWTMFNYNPPIAYWHPLLWCGGILVDHWSTISSLFRYLLYMTTFQLCCWSQAKPWYLFSDQTLVLGSFSTRPTGSLVKHGRRLIGTTAIFQVKCFFLSFFCVNFCPFAGCMILCFW